MMVLSLRTSKASVPVQASQRFQRKVHVHPILKVSGDARCPLAAYGHSPSISGTRDSVSLVTNRSP